VFCDQERITGSQGPPLDLARIKERIDSFLHHHPQAAGPVQAAFYGGNFLGLAESRIRALLEAALAGEEKGRICAIRFSTRPDTVTRERLDLLADYRVQTVELGAQSMNEEVLTQSRRGHTAEDTRQAVGLLKDRGYAVGIQLMVGLPADTEARAMASAMQVANLSPDFVRIYPTLVLKGSGLAEAYVRGDYAPWSLDRSVGVVKDMWRIFNNKNIPVIRMGLQATADLDGGETILAGPYHPAFGHLVLSEITLEKALEALLRAGLTPSRLEGRHLEIGVHPRHLSRMRGQKNANVRRLKAMFRLAGLSIRPEPALELEGIRLKDPT
jgi:histone acetyltransferase (RNA polymerase elongator complex component)